MDDGEMIEAIIRLRDELKRSANIKCKCSSFVLQVQGCSCSKTKFVSDCRNRFWELINSL